jgi:hypothetical protein
MKLTLSIIPQEIIDKYKLSEKGNNGYVLIQINKGMHGLPQTGRFANDSLVKCLAPHCYHPVCLTHGLWKHATHPVMSTMVVEDFGIKYIGKEHVDYLVNALKHDYKVTEDWTGGLYCGIELDWDYKNKTVDLSMPGYISNALYKFQHKEPLRPQHAPYPTQTPHYDSKVQLAPELDTPAYLSPAGKKRIQQVIGFLLYYGRTIDPTILTSISALTSQQSTTVEDTNMKLLLLNYSYARSPSHVRIHTYRHSRVPREPHSLEERWCVRTM